MDGCQTGWMSVEISSGYLKRALIFPSIDDLWIKYSKAKIILIDMPIGLLEKGEKPRRADKAARQLLTRKRSSSVFPIPCRSAVYAENYEKANEISRLKTGKGVSKQSWNISPKIRELDHFLLKNIKLKDIIIESHPEVCLTALAGGNPMSHYKRTEDGYSERIRTLKRFQENIKVFVEEQLDLFDNKETDRDDLVDACVLAISASLGQSNLRFLPANYDIDSKGLPMRMAYPNLTKG